MINVPKEFWGQPEAFQRYLESQGLTQKQKGLDLSPYRAPDIAKGVPALDLLLAAETPRKASQPFVRDSDPVSFEPKPFAPRPVTTVRWRGVKSEGDFEFDLTVYPDTTYDIALNIPQGVTIVSAKIQNMSDEGTLSFLINGSVIIFTSGDTGDTFPTSTPLIPASGSWFLSCNQVASAGADVRVHMLSFTDGGVAYGGLLGSLHYTIP